MARQLNTWSTKSVEEAKLKLQRGEQVSLGCFFEKDMDLRSGNIIFSYTDEEYDELCKCANDVVYFTENYAMFMTDKGRRLVQLRDYQKRVLGILTKEHYIEDMDIYGPENRNIIMCQSRQTGKCSLNAEVEIKDRNGDVYNIQLVELYNKYSTRKESFVYRGLEFLKIKLTSIL